MAPASFNQVTTKKMPEHGYTIPTDWKRKGIVLTNQADGKGSGVSGDPCIVWDDAIRGLENGLLPYTRGPCPGDLHEPE